MALEGVAGGNGLAEHEAYGSARALFDDDEFDNLITDSTRTNEQFDLFSSNRNEEIGSEIFGTNDFGEETAEGGGGGDGTI